MPDGAASDPDGLREAARRVLGEHWREPGFTCPNDVTYPWLWLWDSCFHSIVWAELGEGERAVTELRTALSGQDAEGFVPHLLYLDGSRTHEEFWGRAGSSSITQPPVYGLTVAELLRRGVPVPEELVRQAVDGLRFLLDRRRRSSGGLLEVVHPWETGCDHSPRWDSLMVGDPLGVGSPRDPGEPRRDPYDERTWFDRKGELLASVHRSGAGSPLWNDAFAVGSVAFTAITAHCARELGRITADRSLDGAAVELADALCDRWEPERRTWVDDGPTSRGSGRARTLEAFLPLLVDHRTEALDAVSAELADLDGFAGEYGPPQVHRAEPTHRRGSYWRGPSWPQLDYLLWVALRDAGAGDVAAGLAAATRRGATASGFAEYWDPDDATPGGAAPQSWSTLTLCMKQSEMA